MFNREAGTAQLAWKLSDEEEIVTGRLSVVHHGRTRKHCQVHGSYKDLDNVRLVDGKVDPRLPAVVVAATLSPDSVAECMSRPPAPVVSSWQASHWKCPEGVTLVKLR